MNLSEIGYNVALAQLGLTKEAGVWGRVGGFFNKLLGRGPAKAYMPAGASARASSTVDDALAGMKVKPKEIGMPDRKEIGSIEENFVRRKNPGTVASTAPSNLPKNVARPDPTIRPAAPPAAAPAAAPVAAPAVAPAAAPAAAAAAPAAAAAIPAATDAAATPAAQTGMLAFMRRNPLRSVGMAGAGAGGLGYVAGMGSPPPGQPMQQYGQGPTGYQ